VNFSLPVDTLLPLHGLVVTLRFTEKTQLAFFHQPALAAYVRHLAGSPEQFDALIRIDACESGRVSYRSGELYRFAVIGLNGCLPIFKDLLHALSQLPDNDLIPLDDEKMPFRRNCRLQSVQDLFSSHPVERIGQLMPYRYDDLLAECALWQDYANVKLVFYSPVRLLKDKAARVGYKGEARFCRQKSDLSAVLLGNRCYDTFADLLRRHGEDGFLPRAECSGWSLSDDSHLFWLDCFYTNNKSPSKPMPMGGMMGELHVSVEPGSAKAWLLPVLAQYTGLGQRCAFGWGRFQLQAVTGELSCRRVFPAASLLERVKEQGNLAEAFAHVESNASHESWNDQDDADVLFERLDKDIERLYEGSFKAPELHGIIVLKPDGSPRPLAVPPFRDRVLQRAVAQVLTPAFESVQYQHSYGFRPGRSRLTASYAIQSAWREGYRWVYESDINDFFDNVCWQRLAVRLRALWGSDPLIDAVLEWVRAGVMFEGQLIERKQGLPQGSPLSPLLANLMLDDFDNDMQAAGFKLIRYADDFVVLCKSPEEAERAHKAAELSLQEHGLALDADKTQITSMDKGFHYLGYLFVNDMVLESPNCLRSEDNGEARLSPNSWLAKLGARKPKAIEPSEPRVNVDAPETKAEHKVKSFGERAGRGLLLCVTGASCAISTHNHRVQVSRDEAVLYEVPWRHVRTVLLIGRHYVTGPALTAAMSFNVPVHFTSATGKYEGVVWSGEPGAKGYALWLKQQSICSDPEQALLAARQLVIARLSHVRETLRLRSRPVEVAKLDGLIKQASAAANLSELNGFEGVGTGFYFTALAEIVPEAFGFNGRNRRPPRDPFNALLSLGYTVLYGCVESMLRVDGLLPWCGFYHQPRGRHAALASDLMEPFRHVVERLALSLLTRRELKPDDFYVDDTGACFLTDTARATYLAKLMAKFESRITSINSVEPRTLFEHIHAQNLELIRWLEDGGSFNPWRVR
jgi:group II intron reverse transcriptase/maturase/CRISPR-associated endonuclease Cas1